MILHDALVHGIAKLTSASPDMIRMMSGCLAKEPSSERKA